MCLITLGIEIINLEDELNKYVNNIIIFNSIRF